MPNKWVEFVKKWAKDNNMNYMCAMTTKECKEAYLKEHPKEPKKVKKVKDTPAPPESKYRFNKSDDIDLLLNEMSDMEFGSDILNDASTENKIRELAKKHNIDISKFADSDEGSMVENVLEGVRYGKSKNVYDFFEDYYDLIESLKGKGEEKEMGKEDVPAPAPPAKKVIIRKKKETRKKGTYSTIETEGWLIWDIQQLMDKVVSLGAWSGSLDDIKAIAKKHNVGITKYLRKTELATLDSIIKGLENDDTRENVFHFFEDIYAMLDRYARSKVQKELVDMGKKAMKVADKRANIQMELSEIGKKAKLKEAVGSGLSALSNDELLKMIKTMKK
jgi:hypothetical protein